MLVGGCLGGDSAASECEWLLTGSAIPRRGRLMGQVQQVMHAVSATAPATW
jgi:hypothetical protein